MRQIKDCYLKNRKKEKYIELEIKRCIIVGSKPWSDHQYKKKEEKEIVEYNHLRKEKINK